MLNAPTVHTIEVDIVLYVVCNLATIVYVAEINTEQKISTETNIRID